jgi:succinoglycan biosynthesis protein ExoA
MGNEIISIVLPVYNEAKIIEEVLQTLLQQETGDYELEILVIDGLSTDNSLEVIKNVSLSDDRIRLLVNEKRKTPYALNIGLKEARGDYLCILGAHCKYATDYIYVCLSELIKHEAAGCSGKVITETNNLDIEAQLVSWVMAHPFGVSARSFRTQPEGYVDTIPYPVFRKSALLEVGGYDETLSRNQDNDMNYRLRKNGYKLYSTSKTYCKYYAREKIKLLLEYGYTNGLWCSVNFRKDPRSLNLRYYIPLIFLLSIFLSIGIGIIGNFFLGGINPILIWLISCAQIILHLLIGSTIGIQTAVSKKNIYALFLPALFLAFHISYGLGTMNGLLFYANNSTRAVNLT